MLHRKLISQWGTATPRCSPYAQARSRQGLFNLPTPFSILRAEEACPPPCLARAIYSVYMLFPTSGTKPCLREPHISFFSALPRTFTFASRFRPSCSASTLLELGFSRGSPSWTRANRLSFLSCYISRPGFHSHSWATLLSLEGNPFFSFSPEHHYPAQAKAGYRTLEVTS